MRLAHSKGPRFWSSCSWFRTELEINSKKPSQEWELSFWTDQMQPPSPNIQNRSKSYISRGQNFLTHSYANSWLSYANSWLSYAFLRGAFLHSTARFERLRFSYTFLCILTHILGFLMQFLGFVHILKPSFWGLSCDCFTACPKRTFGDRTWVLSSEQAIWVFFAFFGQASISTKPIQLWNGNPSQIKIDQFLWV